MTTISLNSDFNGTDYCRHVGHHCILPPVLEASLRLLGSNARGSHCAQVLLSCCPEAAGWSSLDWWAREAFGLIQQDVCCGLASESLLVPGTAKQKWSYEGAKECHLMSFRILSMRMDSFRSPSSSLHKKGRAKGCQLALIGTS